MIVNMYQLQWDYKRRKFPTVKEKEKVKKHSVDITLMVYSWSVLSHYVVAILIFSSSLTKTEAVWFLSTDYASISKVESSLCACLNILRVHKVW